MAVIIACLSQKGGVGKSTLARLVARVFLDHKWSTKICDLNTKQKTSTDWAEIRDRAGVTPPIVAEAYSTVRQALEANGEAFDLLVIDGRPDSDTTTLDAARAAHVVVIPVGTSLDDLKPQVLLAHELVTRGVDKSKFIFVINRSVDSDIAVGDARSFIEENGYRVAKNSVAMRVGYQMAQNQGLTIAETLYPSLNEKADGLAKEIAVRAIQKAGV